MNQNKTIGNYRWTICALVFFATTINYLDRQVEEAKIGMISLAYNMRRFMWLERKRVPA